MPQPSLARLPVSFLKALEADDLTKLDAAWKDLESAGGPELLTDHLATSGGTLTAGVAQWCVKKGARTTLAQEIFGFGFADWMSQAIAHDNVELVSWMIQSQAVGADRRLPLGGPTPLMEALGGRKWDLAEAMIRAGASLNGTDLHGNTALHRAAQAYEVQQAVWLIQQGADPQLENKQGHLASELVPQDKGPQWRPDDVYEWLLACEAASSEDRKVIPRSVQTEALVEKIGLTFEDKPQEELTEDEKTVFQALVDRKIIKPQPALPQAQHRSVRPR